MMTLDGITLDRDQDFQTVHLINLKDRYRLSLEENATSCCSL